MDLLTAVTVSMLPLSRARACALYRELRLQRPDVDAGAVLAAAGVPPEDQRVVLDHARDAATRAMRAGAAAGMVPIPWFATGYSGLLNCIGDPPPVLWTRGDAQTLGTPAVAIVGSRGASTYALDVAARLAAELAEYGIAVTSGLARGVDSAAHRGTLEAGGRTIAVLGSGLDRIYPREHESLAGAIASSGIVVSELGPGGAPLPEHFPLRNRIISGISLAVVVVEASEKSGSLITARCAMEQGRDVMAVPGSVLSGRNRGSHALLKDGAKVVETAADIVEELGWLGRSPGAPSTRNLLAADPLLDKLEPGEGAGLDELVEATGQPASRLLTRLMELELAGRVRSVGGRFHAVAPADGRGGPGPGKTAAGGWPAGRGDMV